MAKSKKTDDNVFYEKFFKEINDSEKMWKIFEKIISLPDSKNITLQIKDEKTPETIVEKTFDKQTIISMLSMLSDDSKTIEDFIKKFSSIKTKPNNDTKTLVIRLQDEAKIAAELKKRRVMVAEQLNTITDGLLGAIEKNFESMNRETNKYVPVKKTFKDKVGGFVKSVDWGTVAKVAGFGTVGTLAYLTIKNSMKAPKYLSVDLYTENTEDSETKD